MKNCLDCNKKLKDRRSKRCRSCSKKGILNPHLGKKTIHSEEIKIQLSKMKIGEKNPAWKGDNVGYLGLHAYINKYKPKPEFCEICKVKPPYDLANISQEYKRDLDDWEYLCRKCHMEKDGRLEKLVNHLWL